MLARPASCGQHSVTGRGDRRPVAQATGPTASSTGYGQRLVAQATGPTASSTGYGSLPPHWTRRSVTEVEARKTIRPKMASYVAKLS